MIKLSAVIITFNEERNIGRCIDSLQGVADEIVVVDSHSTDRTAEICREKGARFLLHPFPGYIEQKNYALDCAGNEHVLSLDADEALSPELKESILRAKEHWTSDAYSMNRLTDFCGTWVRHGGWYPDRKVRLFIRSCGRWGGINPHDQFLPAAGTTIGHLSGDLLHYSYRTIDDHLKQIDRFSAIGAKALFAKGVRSGRIKCWYKAIARFFKHYLVLAGFLDGRTGWIIAINSAKGVWKKYDLLYRLQKGESI